MNIKIRHFETSDTDDLAEIYSFQSVTENTSQLPFLSCNKVATLFDNADNYTLVAVTQTGTPNTEKVLGHVTLFLTQKVRDRHSASLAIAVHPEAHGTGVGKLLMSEAINQADNWLNLIRLELEVHCDNTAAISLYQKNGFSVEGEKKLSTFKAGKYMNMLIMSRIRSDYAMSDA